MKRYDEIMVEKIEALAQRIRKGELQVSEVNVSQPAIDDHKGWVHGIDAKKPGLDIYWVIHLIAKSL